MTQIEIVARPFKLGDREMAQTDRFDPSDAYQRRFLTEEAILNLRRIKQVVPLERETYRILASRFGQGHVGRGFARAELEALGILDPVEPEPAPPAAAPKAKAKAPKPAPAADLAVVDVPDTAEEINGYMLIPRRVGKSSFVHFDVANKAGQLLRPSRFKKRDAAVSYLMGLPSPTAAEGGTSGEGESETGDDLHVQSQSDGSDQ